MKGSAWSIERLNSADKKTANDVLAFLIDNKEPCFEWPPIMETVRFGRDQQDTCAIRALGFDRCGTTITNFHHGHDRFICEKPL